MPRMPRPEREPSAQPTAHVGRRPAVPPIPAGGRPHFDASVPAPRRPVRRLALAAAITFLLAWWRWPAEPAEALPWSATPARTAAPRPAEPATPVTSAAIPAPVPSARATELTDEVLDLDLPETFALEVQVVDTFGLPVEHARLFVAPPLCAFGLAPAASDARGRMRFSCRGRSARLPVWLAAMAFGTVEPLRSLVLTAGTTNHLTLAVHGTQTTPDQQHQLLAQIEQSPEELMFRQQLAQAAQNARHGEVVRYTAEDTVCGRRVFLFREVECLVCHDRSRVAGYLPLRWAARLQSTLHPHATFTDMLLEQPVGLGRKQLDDELAADHPNAYTVRMTRERGAVSQAAGTVRTNTGKPAAGVPVVWLDRDGAVHQRCVTSADGSYRMALPADGPCTIVAAGGPLGRAEAVVAAPLGGEARRDLDLQPQQLVRGRAVDASGAPLADCRVLFEGVDEPGAALTTTSPDGTFAFSHLPRSGRCLLWAKDADLKLPVAVSEPLLTDNDHVLLQLSEARPTRAHLRLRAGRPTGHGQARVEVRLLQTDSGIASHVDSSSFDSTFDLDGLAPGLYQGEIGAQGLGWVPFGPIHIDGRGTWDLGTIALPLPGRVRFTTTPGEAVPIDLGAQFFRRTETTDVQVTPRQLGRDTYELPAGDHVVLWRRAGDLQGRSFQVTSGEQVDVAVPH